jgi:hypothetical protein
MPAAVSSLELPWTVWLAFVVVLSASWLLDRYIRGRTLHGVISVCSLIAASACLTPRWSERVRGKVPSGYSSARAAQLNR